jgi:hypothetical protein
MTDDNTIDIVDRLPPIEVRKPWRKRLPSFYVERIKALKTAHRNVKEICTVLSCMPDDFQKEAAEDHRHEFELKIVADNISAALVLLRCAEEKLMYSIPMEELMSPEDLKQFLGRSPEV